MQYFIIALVGVLIFAVTAPLAMAQSPMKTSIWKNWKASEWSRTDFSKTSIDLSEVMSGGPPKDGIPAIDNPKFVPVSKTTNLGDKEPVIMVKIGQVAKAYPLRVLMFHEIANDVLGGVPITVTYCPLCNAAIVYDRRVDGDILDFGVSGKLRNSDMIMYDRQSESWWQQFVGRAIVGEMLGTQLKRLPARVVPFSSFKASYPDGLVLTPSFSLTRRYGRNPYMHYDSAKRPFLYRGRYDGPKSPMSYVVSVEQEAWFLDDLRQVGHIDAGDIRLKWHEGMNSALDSSRIDKGRDIGFVVAQRKQADGVYKDIAYDTTFAFAFKAFYPDGIIHVRP